jgi:hypothetical protein
LLTIPASHRLLLSALVACAAFAGPARADGEHDSEAVAEVNAYIKLSERFRLFTTANMTKSLTEGVKDNEIGAYLDVLSRNRLFGQRLLEIDATRDRDLWGRVGFTFGGIHEGNRRSTAYRERQFVFELSGRYPIADGFVVLTRARFDARTLNGGNANRYRFRVGIEKTYKAFGTELVPYARAEILYDTRFSALHKQIYQVGVDIDITKQFGIEPYYAFQRDTATDPARLDRFGLILKYYR